MMSLVSERILAVVPADWHGVRRALSCYTSTFVTPDHAVATIDSLRPTTVIFGCYQREWYAIAERAHVHRTRCVVAWFASTVLNEFDERNREWLYASLQSVRRGHIHEMVTPHKGTASLWRESGIPSRYLPLSFVPPSVQSIARSDGLHVGLFGSGQPWKNMETQALAVQILRRRPGTVTLHVQNEHAVRAARRFFDIPVVVHQNSLSDDDYYRLIGSMHVNLIVSLSETYSYLGAESLALGVPILTTPLTPILSTAPGELRTYCVIDQFDDPTIIADYIERIYAHRITLGRLGQEHILSYNKYEQQHVAQVQNKWLQPLTS